MWQQVTTGGQSREKRYFTQLYETVTEDSVTKNLHYLYAPSGLFAIFATSDNTETMHYTFTDHQGSLTAYTTGSSVTRLSYDAWGRRRNPSSGNVAEPVEAAFDRGYTGHEHLDEFGLINMNGRLYDPMLGRMLSPDIVVQQTDYTQSYNRYSYCFNNPLRFTDPTGWVVDIDPEIRQIGSIALRYHDKPSRRLAKQLEKLGVDIHSISVEYNTDVSQGGLESKTISWNKIEQTGDENRHYLDVLTYNFPSLNWGKPEGQHYKLGCLAFGLVQQEGRFSNGNCRITEESIMRTDYDSKESGLKVPEVMNNYFMEHTNSYKGFDYLAHPSVSVDFSRIVFENMENNNSVSLDLSQPVTVFGVLNHFVNVSTSYRYHIGDSNHFEYDYHPWGSSGSNANLKITNYLLMYPK